MVRRKQGFLLLYRVLSNVESRNLDKVNCGPLQATTCGARMDAPPCLHPGMDAKATVGSSQAGKCFATCLARSNSQAHSTQDCSFPRVPRFVASAGHRDSECNRCVGACCAGYDESKCTAVLWLWEFFRAKIMTSFMAGYRVWILLGSDAVTMHLLLGSSIW